ncbi:hypothetical protein HDU81_008316 [Chytriomyces hyalinus]|nr:hypothetical protein HDU81_008316 [Chytriomyces hyalinus]
MDPRLNKLALMDTRMQETTPSPSPTESVQFRYPTITTITATTSRANKPTKQQMNKQQKLRKTCKQSIVKPVAAESALLQIKSNMHKMSIAFLVQDVDECKMMYRSRLHYVRPKSVQDSWQRSKGGPENALDGRKTGSSAKTKSAAVSVDRTQQLS